MHLPCAGEHKGEDRCASQGQCGIIKNPVQTLNVIFWILLAFDFLQFNQDNAISIHLEPFLISWKVIMLKIRGLQPTALILDHSSFHSLIVIPVQKWSELLWGFQELCLFCNLSYLHENMCLTGRKKPTCRYREMQTEVSEGGLKIMFTTV